jgi:thiol:disulfide interchange protein
VVVSFWILAGLLVALQSAGNELGWGFQLQSPLFVSVLALLFFAMALNLSGVFEFGNILPPGIDGARVPGPRTDAFLTGVLAVAVASPCTAPFMGAALGYALAQTAATAFLIFTSLALGMALPYVMLAWHPRWLKWVPKPGVWMLRLEQFLAFPLYATVIWLAWVLGEQAGLDAVILLLGALLALGIAAWLIDMPAKSWIRTLMASLAAFSIALAYVASLEPAPPPRQIVELWEPWSAPRVTALVAQRKPVFVDFTAAWCVTCQVNKRMVLSQPDIEKAFRDKGVTLLRADWTRHDPEIGRALAALGRNGVPVYVLYRTGQPPILLPEILTRDIVLGAIENIAN